MPASVRPVPYAITLPSDLKLLVLARTFVDTICRSLNHDDLFCDAIKLATHEAMQNVIRHAHAGCCERLVEIQVIPLKDGLEVRLLDEGAPFDVASVPHWEPGELRIGGRGVYLMRRLMDELVSEQRASHGNMLRMVKRCKGMSRRHPA